MRNKILQQRRKLLLVLLLTIVGMTNVLAQEFIVDKLKYSIMDNGDCVEVIGLVDNKSMEGSLSIPNIITWKEKEYPVTQISHHAFENCNGLTSISIPNTVTSIEQSAFKGCRGINAIYIPDNVATIGFFAFKDCSELTTVTIPNTVTRILGGAFEGCVKLTSIIIPSSVTSIASDIFVNCPELARIVVASDNKIYDSRGDCNAIIETKSNQLIIGCKNTVVPNTITGISSRAFDGCAKLTSINIPSSVTSIGIAAFANCPDLARITVTSDNKKYDSRDNCNAIVETESNRVISGCKNTFIPNSITSIEQNAFQGCKGLTSISIPNSVTDIGWYAFEDCLGLTSVLIPSSVTRIGDFTFAGCTGLNSISISNSVTHIGSQAFRGCTGLTMFDIPDLVTEIAVSAFEGCTALNSVSIPKTVKIISEKAFYGCTSLCSIAIPKSVYRIGENALTNTGWYNLQQDGILYLDNCCLGYKGEKPSGNLLLNNDTRLIADMAFYDCSGLTGTITIPSDAIVADDAFYGCDILIKFVDTDVQRWVDMGIRDENGKTIYWADADFVVFKDGSFGLANYGEIGSLVGWGDVTGNASGSDLSNYGGDYPPLNISGNTRYDIVSAGLGEKYRMPTSADFISLIENCDIEYKTITKEVVGLGGLPSWVQGEWMWQSSDLINGKVTNASINLRIDGYLASVYTSEKEYWEGTYSYEGGVLSVWKLDLLIDDINKIIRDNKGYQFRKISDNTKTSKTTGFIFKSRINGNTLFFVMPSSMTMGTNGSAVISWENPQEYDYWTGALYPEKKHCAIIFRQNKEGYGMMAIPRYSHCRIRPVKVGK